MICQRQLYADLLRTLSLALCMYPLQRPLSERERLPNVLRQPGQRHAMAHAPMEDRHRQDDHPQPTPLDHGERLALLLAAHATVGALHLVGHVSAIPRHDDPFRPAARDRDRPDDRWTPRDAPRV